MGSGFEKREAGFLILGTGVCSPMLSKDKNSTLALTPDEEYYLITYQYVMPLIAIVGFAGNFTNLYVLSSRELRRVTMKGTGGQRVSKRSEAMYTYMKALAVTDILYLILTIEGCIFTSLGYFRSTNAKDMPTQSMGIYVWNYMSALWNGFAASSDAIVAVMTVTRYQILNDIEKSAGLNGDGTLKTGWIIGVAITFSLAMHIPYLFQFYIVPCSNSTDFNFDFENQTCWRSKNSQITSTVLWQFYGYIYEVVVKALPMLLIFVLNLLMLIKMRAIFKKRRELRARQSIFSNPPSVATPISKDEADTIEEEGQKSLVIPAILVTPNSNSENGASTVPSRRGTDRSRRKSRSPNTLVRENRKQMKLNGLLVALALCHCLLTAPGNLAFLMWTNFPELWANFEGRSTFSTVANTLYVINYSKNFYLYSAIHADIREATATKFSAMYQSFKSTCF